MEQVGATSFYGSGSIDITDLGFAGIGSGTGAINPRWCVNRPAVGTPRSRFACQRIRAETGMPRLVILFSTLHPSFASVR